MTTQSPHLYAPQHLPAADRAEDTPAAGMRARDAQTRLPWWAVALPALAFAALLALLSGADASAAAPTGDLLGRFMTALPDLVHRLL